MSDKFSGAKSAARIIGLSRWESECGFGSCAGHPDCRDKHCPEHPCKTGMLGLPVIDAKFLDDQLGDPYSSCDSHFKIEHVGPEPEFFQSAGKVKAVTLFVAVLAVMAFVVWVHS